MPPENRTSKKRLPRSGVRQGTPATFTRSVPVFRLLPSRAQPENQIRPFQPTPFPTLFSLHEEIAKAILPLNDNIHYNHDITYNHTSRNDTRYASINILQLRYGNNIIHRYIIFYKNTHIIGNLYIKKSTLRMEIPARSKRLEPHSPASAPSAASGGKSCLSL